MFRYVAISTALVLTYVGLVLLFAPEVQMAFLGVDPTPSGAVMGRRSAPLFLALAGLIWGFRHEAAGRMRQSICLGYGAMFAFIAVIGVKDLLAGAVTRDILAAIAVESVLAVVLLLCARRT